MGEGRNKTGSSSSAACFLVFEVVHVYNEQHFSSTRGIYSANQAVLESRQDQHV